MKKHIFLLIITLICSSNSLYAMEKDPYFTSIPFRKSVNRLFKLWKNTCLLPLSEQIEISQRVTQAVAKRQTETLERNKKRQEKKIGSIRNQLNPQEPFLHSPEKPKKFRNFINHRRNQH